MGKSHDISGCSECVIILGTYINACSIALGLQKISYSHPIVLIDPLINKGKCMADIILTNVSVFKKKIRNDDEIVSLINEIVPLQTKKIILSTSEEFLDPLKNAIANSKIANAIAYTGAGIGNDVIFDRMKFYSLVQRLGCISVPDTVEHTKDPFSRFGNKFVIRVKRSWIGNKKLPRLQIVDGADHKARIESEFLKDSITPDMWCYQELLSIDDKHNVSVCGWYDKEYKQYVVTRKVLQHPPKTGNGDVVESISDFPEILVSATECILKALEYQGPFEMEFVMDKETGQYKVIELNPRFWMQHGLVGELTKEALVRRAVGWPVDPAIHPLNLCHRYWINGNQLIFRLLKLQFGILRYLKDSTVYPSIVRSFRWLTYYPAYKENIKQSIPKRV